MTDQSFLERGYTEYPPSSIDPQNVVKLFQKCFKDDIGKKYFITAKKWDSWRHPYTGDVIPPAYEYEIQLYAKGTENAIDILFHSSWDVESVEQHVADLFATGNYKYYERWGGYDD